MDEVLQVKLEQRLPSVLQRVPPDSEPVVGLQAYGWMKNSLSSFKQILQEVCKYVNAP